MLIIIEVMQNTVTSVTIEQTTCTFFINVIIKHFIANQNCCYHYNYLILFLNIIHNIWEVYRMTDAICLPKIE